MAIQPARTAEPSLLNTKVKHPSGVVEVNGPGRLAPVKLASLRFVYCSNIAPERLAP